MADIKIDEGIMYCTSCGAANKKSAIICEECENKIIAKHSPFRSFLLKRIKGETIDFGKENLYEIIKRFLFQHLYGLVMTVAVVTTGTVVIANPNSHIRTVTEVPKTNAVAKQQVVESQVAEEEIVEEKTYELTEDDHIWIDHTISAYDAIIDNTLMPRSIYWSKPEEYSSGSELWAENNIAGYEYKGTHDMFTNPIPVGLIELEDFYGEEDEEPYGYRDWIEQSIVTGSDVKSELGQKLFKNGYDVLEIDYYIVTFKGYQEDIDYTKPLPADKEYHEKVKYVFLLTRKTGEERWYIAEERLTERFGI